jgi:Carboxypeptidase regulatory-like domain/TonB-dependent Receptor Plug Domain
VSRSPSPFPILSRSLATIGARRLLGPLAALGLLVFGALPAAAQNPPATPPAAGGVSFLYGTVVDSLHGALLTGALVRVDGAPREGITDSEGKYRIDSIPPGAHRLIVMHPVLDTVGISLVTPPLIFKAGEASQMDLAVPSAESLVNILCPAARRQMGPAALVGIVRDADTDAPAEGAKVSLLYYEADPLGLRKTPRVREAVIGKDGKYRICGLPANMSGKVQVFHAGVSSGEVPVEIPDGLLALRSMSISTKVSVATQVVDSGKRTTQIYRGSSRVSGKVVNKYGQPVVGARVGLQGTSAATLTRGNGDFSLDSLPAGTQTLEVRQLGFAPQEMAVELSTAQPQNVTVKMSDYVPVLQTMRVSAQRERGLQDVGFSDRKRTSSGHFIDGDEIEKRKTSQFSDLLRTAPGLKVVPGGNGQNVIQSSRDAMGGCVQFYVDGAPWQQQYPGDLDSFVRTDEVGGIEIYNPSTVPAQFQQGGQSSCVTVVIWTNFRLNRKR